MKFRTFLLTIIIILFYTSSLNSQIKLSGTIIDSDSKDPSEFANIVLLKGDSTFIDGTSCDSTGFFVFTTLMHGDYILSSAFLGHEKTFIKVDNLDCDRDLGIIIMKSSSIALNEVTVTGSTVIQKVDRKLLIPSITQIKASNNGLKLLRNMQLSRIAINPISNSVTTQGGEAVQLRINGIEVTIVEVIALQPQDIIRIEYHEDPGIRYGNVAAVIDYITQRRYSGGSISTEFMNGFWRLGFAEDIISAKLNHKKSEFGANAYFHYRSLKWTHENHETFVFPDRILNRDEVGKPTKYNEKTLNLVLNYSFNEPDKYLFNATFRNYYNNTPNHYTDRKSVLYTSTDSSLISDHSTWWNNTPSLDLYYQRNLKNNQLIIVNAVGTYMDSKSTRLFEQYPTNAESYTSYSCITGTKYSLIAEAIYEKILENGKITGGLKHTQSYTENNYTGNVAGQVGLNVSETYGYAEYQLRRNKFNYSFGLGAMRTFNSQDDTSMEKYIFRPALRISYNINDNTYIRYNGFISGNAPSLSYLNNVTQNIDDLQIQKGNPYLQTVWFVSNTINAGYNKKQVELEFNTRYNYHNKPIMEQISFKENIFVHTNVNQQALHQVFSEITFKLKPLKDYISLSITPGLNHYVSVGNDYYHKYDNWRVRGSLFVTYKQWFLNGDIYSRWNDLWGETVNIGERLIILSAGYKTSKWSASVVMLNPFTNEYSIGYENRSALARYISNIYTRNLGQVIVFNLSLNLNFGRKYQVADKRLDNADSDAGIMTGTKK